MFEFFKKMARRWFGNFLTFLGLSYFYPGFSIGGGIKSLILLALAMTVVETFFQPLLKMLLIPVNLITFGMFSWLLTTVELLIAVYMVRAAQFQAFVFENFNFLEFTIEAMSVNRFFSVILGTIIFNFIDKLVENLSERSE